MEGKAEDTGKAAEKNADGKRSITVELRDKEYSFEYSRYHVEEFQREAQKSPPRAAKNFLLSTSTDRDALKAEFADDWTLHLVLIEPVLDAIGLDRAATVKK